MLAAHGLEPVVLRYGSFYGPGASDEFVPLIRKRRMPVVGSGAGVWSFVHIDDAAAAMVLAVESDVTGLFNIVDDEPAPVREWLPCLAEAVGAKPPRRVPAWRPARSGCRCSPRSAARPTPRWPSWRDGFRFGLTDGELPSYHGAG